MQISATDRALLSACAEAMATGQDPKIDLQNASRTLFTRDVPTIEELALLVEKFSGEKKTVREADVALFKRHGGMNLNLVVCPAETPKILITALTEEMILYYAGRYRHGLTKETPASPEEVRIYRDFVAKVDRKNRQEQRAKGTLSLIVQKVLEEVRVQIDACTDKTRQEDALCALEAEDLTELATACEALGISFKDILREALK